MMFEFSGLLINCGATVRSTIEGREWLPDKDYISTGTSKTITTPGLPQILSTVRSFPLSGRKFCYTVPAYRPGKYLIRTTYFYGGVNGDEVPPVFDQIVDGTLWSVVNTTDDYRRGFSSYYEGVFTPTGRTMSVCLGVNTYTESDPFISGLEFVILGDSLYNSTDFKTYGLSLVARHSFGYDGSIIKYPDDQFDRFWEPFGEYNPILSRARNVSVSGFWNLPPSKSFETKFTIPEPKSLTFQWPTSSLPNSTYYIALYFAEDSDTSSGVSRVFNISINDVLFFRELNVIPDGVVVYAKQWPVAGPMTITLTPASGSTLGPLINAGEIFDLVLLGGKTHTKDVIALERLRNSFQNPPLDWTGDPCLPRQYSWTGVTCSEGTRIRVIALNLTSMGLSGSLSPSIANLTALSNILLGNNSLSGPIPDLSPLKALAILHLEKNQLRGTIPPSLGNMDTLRELFLQENKLTGQVPSSLTGRPELDLRLSPGNSFSSPPPS